MADSDSDDTKKRDALKGLIKEAVGEYVEEHKEKGRTDTGDKDAKKSGGSIFDIFGS